MNGVHDMGGMHGLGPICRESNEPLFHEPWEARVLAMTLAVGAWSRWNIDSSRHHRERIPGAAYLAMTYYEKWLTALIALIVETGLATPEEIEQSRPAQGSRKTIAPLAAASVRAALSAGSPYSREDATRPHFAIGDRVRTRNLNPPGHTRLPRYARSRLGVVEHDHGTHVFPDANAHGAGECPQRLYGVRFAARELWGAAASERDTVHIDLWEPYLEPA